jgi:predicted dehydrogenase
VSNLRVAVIGAGYWGPNLVRNFNACPDTELIAICDLDTARAAKVGGSYPGVTITDDLDGLLAGGTIAAVAIATPVATHFPIATKALEAGKHVLLEKPLARTVAEGEALVKMAAERGLSLMCDHTFCYGGPVRLIHDIVAAGDLGQILYFDSVRVNLGLFQSDVNVLWDLAPHDLSIIDHILPQGLNPIAISAQGLDAMNTGYESIAYLTMFFEENLICHVHANWLSPVKVRDILVGGTKKMIFWDDNNPAERIKVFNKGVEVQEADRDRILVNYRHGAGEIPVIEPAEALSEVAKEFAASVREKRPALTDGEAGLRVLRILEAADTSLRENGRRVEI